MGKATNLVERIMSNKNNYLKTTLTQTETIYRREWRAYNLLVGENGAGKSRILQMIKENADKEECIVIHMDFANSISTGVSNNSNFPDETGKGELEEMLIYNDMANSVIFLDFLTHVNTQVLNIFHRLSKMENGEDRFYQSRAEKILNKMKPSIKNVLHREILVKEDNVYLKKGSREVAITEEWLYMSPGERSILAIIIAVLIIAIINKPCILLIDEIETHLHPDAQVKLYKLLKRSLEDAKADCCTCIASHSIFLLPLFDIQEVVYINNGRIEKMNGTLYQQVYDNLTGEGNTGEESLTDFLYSMSAWQYADFLAQCFLEPILVDAASSKDEQVLKFTKALKKIYDRKELTEVLDYGAGSARVGRCIELMLDKDEETLRMVSKMKYHIYDKYTISRKFEPNTGWRGRAYKDEEELSSAGQKFDIILLFNVLHEISIDKWVTDLNFILDLLEEEGILLFSEREILSVGEKPYGKSGYLVMGKDELLKLFPQMEIREINLPEKQREVAVCFEMKRNTERRMPVMEADVKSALEELIQNTRKKIRYRQENGLGKNAKSREYAFYCQQYVNAQEALEILEKKEENGTKKEDLPRNTELQKEEEEKGKVDLWYNEETTMEDVIQSDAPPVEKMRKIGELSKLDTEEGKKCRKYLEEQKQRSSK